MSEKYPPPSPENDFHGRLSKRLMGMMSFAATLNNYKPPESEDAFSADETIRFARRIKSPGFDELTRIAFLGKGLSTLLANDAPNLIPLTKLCLLTGPNVMMQIQTRAGDRSFREDLSEYNQTVRDTIRANPNMSAEALTYVMEGAMWWAKIPKSYHVQAMDDLKKIIHGASSEVVAEQLLDSEAAREAGITYENSSTEDDLNGIDFIVTLADKTELLLDIKRSDEQVQPVGLADYTTPSYRPIKDSRYPHAARIMLYVGANDALKEGQLQLDEEYIEPKGMALVETLQEIDRQERERLLAQLAMKKW